MSGYGNNYRGTYTDNNGLRPNSGHVSDHTEGRKRPIIPYMPNHSGGSIITKTEIVEHVIVPTIITEYTHSHAAEKVEPWKNDRVVADKNYVSTDHKWYKPSSPVKHYAYADDEKLRRPSSPLKSYGPTPTDEKLRRPSSPVKSYYGGTDEKWRTPSSPVKNFGANEDKWRRPSSPGKTYGPIEEKRWISPSGQVKDYGNAKEKWHRAGSPVKSYGDSEGKQRISPSGPMKDYGYTDDDKWRRPSSPVKSIYRDSDGKWHNQDHQRQPKEVEEFITNVQTEASRPNKFVPMRARNWQQTPNNNNGYDQSYNNGYYPKNQDEPRDVVTSGGWVRPTRTTWSAPPTNGSLSSPVNNIGAAVEMLKEAVQPNSQATYTQPTRYQVPVISRLNMDGYSSAVIDSREAAKRYGNFSLGSRPVENYTNTIDSREATRKYGGLRV